jgi:hypothetical protein
MPAGTIMAFGGQFGQGYHQLERLKKQDLDLPEPGTMVLVLGRWRQSLQRSMSDRGRQR